MKRVLQFLGDIFRFHKLKLLLAFCSFILFLFILFPFNDLGTFVTAQVAEQSQNNVFLKFDELSLSVFPLGLDFTNVEVQTTAFPAVKARELTLAPTILGLLTFNPGLTAKAKGLLKGDVSLSTRGEKKATDGKAAKVLQNIELDASGLDLASALSMVSNLSGLEGKIDLGVSGKIDPQFEEQPSMDLLVEGQKVQLVNFSIDTVMGAFPLPDISLQKLRLKGVLQEGRLNIEEGIIGNDTDDLYAQIKGTLRVTVEAHRGQVSPVLGGYNLSVRIKTKKAFQDRASLFFAFIENMKVSSSSTANPEYMFRVETSDVRMPPNMTPLTSFN